MNFLSNSNSNNTFDFNSFINNLLHTTGHDRFMHLKIFIDIDSPDELKNIYVNSAFNHNQKIMIDPHFFDAGFDLFLPQNTVFDSTQVNKVDFKVKCCAEIHHLSMNYDANNNYSRRYFSGFYVHPRSSLSKTSLRLANSTGIIDAGYRGNLIGMFDCITNTNNSSSSSSSSSGGSAFTNDNYTLGQFTRLLQICGPSLMPIYVEIVDSIEYLGPNTSRGGGGFGSTGL